jgi:hypothetical protein
MFFEKLADIQLHVEYFTFYGNRQLITVLARFWLVLSVLGCRN